MKMNAKISIALMLVLFGALYAHAQVSVEQYYYLEKDKALLWGPIVHYQSASNWYAEARYNYEASNSVSLYTGRTFSHEGNLSYSATPMVGGVAGDYKGMSMGLNMAVDYKSVFFSSQSQYTMGMGDEDEDFVFAWSELGYQVCSWLYGGVSAQHTYERLTGVVFEPGIFLGVEVGRWSFPVYGFASGDNNSFFVVGINLDLGSNERD